MKFYTGNFYYGDMTDKSWNTEWIDTASVGNEEFKNVFAPKNKPATTEELLEAVLSMRSLLRVQS
jgi:hypothetical protein